MWQCFKLKRRVVNWLDLQVDGSEPVFSTSHGAAFTTVDYIWYTPQVTGTDSVYRYF